jgi:hypothetical protein
VIKLHYEEMKKAQLRMCEAIIAMIAEAFLPLDNLPLLLSQLGVKSDLAGLSFTQDAS